MARAGGQRLLQLLPSRMRPVRRRRTPRSARWRSTRVHHHRGFEALTRSARSVARTGAQGAPEAVRWRPRSITPASGPSAAGSRRTFAQFRDTEWIGRQRRASAFRAYSDQQAWWLDDYALFRALHARYEERAWTDWPAPLRTATAGARRCARRAFRRHPVPTYLQWNRRRSGGVARTARQRRLFGDLPFMVSGDSADVWSRQDEFRLDASVGVPPAAFSDTDRTGDCRLTDGRSLRARLRLLRHRARRNADCTTAIASIIWSFSTGPTQAAPRRRSDSHPLDQQSQHRSRAHPRRVPRARVGNHAEDRSGRCPSLCASPSRDLPFRLQGLGLERHWHAEGQPFKTPRVSGGGSGHVRDARHGTDVVWWENAPREERRASCHSIVAARLEPEAGTAGRQPVCRT